MQVSVIIINYNTTDLTMQCVESVLKHTKDITFEVIVVDNASKDRSICSLTKTFPQTRLMLNVENIGFGRANNLGMEVAKGQYFFLLNSDAYLLENSIKQFYDFMEQRGNACCGICGGELSTGSTRPTVSYGNFPTMLNILGSFGFWILARNYYLMHMSLGVVNTQSEVRDVDFVSGAAMFLRRKAIEEAGAFDSDFFLYFEETELAYRFKQKGYRSAILPYIKIIHLEKGSQQSSGFNYFHYQQFATGRNLFYKKTYGHGFARMAKVLHGFHCLVFTLMRKEKGDLLRKLKIVYFS